MDIEGKEVVIASQPKIEDFSANRTEVFGKESLLVDAEAIGASKWQSMVDATQMDYKERGVVISRRNNGKLLTSKMLEGFGEEFDYENPSKKISAAFVPPLLPHGARSLLPKIKDIVVVHSHPMPPEVDHLKTTMFSDADIHSFIKTDYNALVMVDRGGAHLLVRTGYSLGENPLSGRDIVGETIKKVKQEQGGTMDVIKSLAMQLPNYGLGYFYTPTLQSDPKEGFVKFHKPQGVE